MTSPARVESVTSFFAGLGDRDLAPVAAVLADDVVHVLTHSLSGAPEPQAVLTGKDEVLGFLRTVLDLFSRTRVEDLEVFETVGRDVVFASARGDFTHAASGAPYRNDYLYRFDFTGDRITWFAEHGNPVAFAKATGAPLG
ncbi:nuclear transport factor 2 family protein [Actinosynnema mirum]|uniref:SnoaL-like domain-containing protein n=1 Tax=Actinosynnema mirum (strain ATCC 29888 / DSM 43827 / JCM 3225 / NBRC 14064 / NCIMB 13271 / NRRL B-12336 / IMRU 3971 / 101) TaxID=446462 RepID=C6WLD5_ACTMD|nr:nuclear transport factor 2 family protein [Actinosynnema mirum]ACU38328.1 conserved hypothetical protein [Actinosynnema mirum DSM 43827]